jgi:hypothetical protein
MAAWRRAIANIGHLLTSIATRPGPFRGRVSAVADR